MQDIRDKLWLWGHPANSHFRQFGLPQRESRMGPAEAAKWMGIPNVVMVVYGGNPAPPFEAHHRPLDGLRRVVWSIVGDSSSGRNDEQTDVEEVVALAGRHKNVCGAILDDLFNAPENGSRRWRVEAEELARLASRLHGDGAGTRRLDLWGVLYAHQFDLPIAAHLRALDVVTFWTWHARDLGKLEANFARCEQLTPGKRRVLGCYMWDYGDGKPMPTELMEYQCQLGRKWLEDGRIEGMIFLASCICDMGLEIVEWTRRWIEGV